MITSLILGSAFLGAWSGSGTYGQSIITQECASVKLEVALDTRADESGDEVPSVFHVRRYETDCQGGNFGWEERSLEVKDDGALYDAEGEPVGWISDEKITWIKALNALTWYEYEMSFDEEGRMVFVDRLTNGLKDLIRVDAVMDFVPPADDAVIVEKCLGSFC
jgi:hypothetical protein